MMAKESGSTRIPRLDSGTRIPLPSSVRSAANAGTQQAGKPSLLKSSVVNHAGKRPTSFAALTPPFTDNGSNLKKSSSGERLNNAVNIVSKKTTSVLKRFFGIPQPKQHQPLNIPAARVLAPDDGPKSANDVTVTISTGTPRTTLTRSETFIRSQNDLHLLDGATTTYQAMAQSTPATGSLKTQQGTRIPFQNIKSLDATFTPKSNAYKTRNLTPSFDKTDSKSIGKTFNGTMEMCKTMTVVSPSKLQQNQKDRKSGIAQLNMNQTKTLDHSPKYFNYDIDMTQIIKTGKSLMSSSGISTPATDATFSTPGSIENLQMIEDVSVPSGFDLDVTLQPEEDVADVKGPDATKSLAPDKTHLKLPLNSTMNTSVLLELTSDGAISPVSQLRLLDITKDGFDERQQTNSTALLYLTPHAASATTTPDLKPKLIGVEAPHNISPFSLKSAQSDLVLPTQTPDDASLKSKAAAHAEQFYGDTQARGAAATAISLQDVSNSNQKPRSRFSFGADLTESTLDCSIELVDVSLSSTAVALMGNSHSQQSLSMQQLHSQQHQQQQQQQQQTLKKHNSIDMDESLGILTPDQMKEFLDSTATNTNNMEMALGLSATAACISSNKQQLSFNQIRMDQTPSPEELPLDPVEVKTDCGDLVVSMAQQQHRQQQAAFSLAAQQQQQTQQMAQQSQVQTSSISTEQVSSHTDTELSKTEPIMTKSNVSKISTSFITSVTSVTSLDTGYQGDGEMSRPASRGAGDHSPSNGPTTRRCGHVSRQPSFNQQFQQQNHLPPIRRQDPMTDSDFFTESDADDLLHRGDRRAQVIDGQLYNCPTLQSAASVFITEDPQMEDSCMESSGIFTDAENRCEEDLAQMRRQENVVQDMSPDGEGEDSTETVRSNRERNGKAMNYDPDAAAGQGQPLQHNSSSHTIPSHSCSADRLSTTISNRTSYCSVEEAFFDDTSVHKNVTKAKIENDNKVIGGGSKAEYNEAPAPKKIAKTHLKSETGSIDSGGSRAKQSKSIASARSKGANSKSGSESLTARKVTHAPNKWDVVMNKIASNKATVRKNYNDVKSKVSTTRASTMGSGSGTASPTTPTLRRTPISALGSGGGGSLSSINSANRNVRASKATSAMATATPTGVKKTNEAASRNGSQLQQTQAQVHSKRLLQGATKRGRSYSKDSQKSSQSDLSMASGAGSPKNLAKTPLRAAKKRDVRNLSISPTDLGPPPKAQQTANGASPPRVKSSVIASAKKRVLSLTPPHKTTTTTNSATATSSASSTKSSSTSPTNLRRGTVKVNSATIVCSNPPAKTAHGVAASTAEVTKDSNRLSTIEQVIETANKNGIRTDTATELKEINCNGLDKQQPPNIHPLQHNNNIQNHSIPKTTSEVSKVSNSTNTLPPVEIEQQNVLKTNSVVMHSPVGALAPISEKKSSPKTQTVRKAQFQKQQKPNSENKPLPPTRTERLDSSELEQLRLVNRYSCNGRLDYVSSREQQLQRLQQDKSVEAMGVLIQYLVYELDAFSCPKYKSECLKSQDTIQKTLCLLDEAKHTCTQLQDQLCDKETYYAQREEELQSLHRCELEKARSNYSDLQKQAKEEIAGLENQLCERDIEHQRLMSCYRLEMESKCAEQLNQIRAAEANEREFQQRIATLEASNKDLEFKLKIVEEEALKEANAAAARESSLEARVAELTNEFETLRARRPISEREDQRMRRDRTEFSHDEIAILRPSRCSFDSRVNMKASRGMPRNFLPAEVSHLESEVESLRCVLEMRQSEISRLTKQNEELLRDADDRAAMRAEISKLNAVIEMLRSELDIKTEKEKEYQIQLDKIHKDVSYEKTKSTRLGYDNEALQWQLKQRSEQLHIVEAKLHETLNSSSSLNSTSARRSSQSGSYNSISRQTSLHESNASLPLSPVIKGVIQKPDSVSYVLEIDDETPEIAASKMVKRASSTFRSSKSNPKTRRHLPSSANNSTSNLSQSLSAGSVLRQHSSDSVSEHNARTAHARTRSRSVSIKDEPSGQLLNELLLPMEFPYHSSPYPNSMRPRTSTMKVGTSQTHDEQDEQAIYKRSHSASKSSAQPRLITCDTSALDSGERLDERMLPSHPSIHDLKVPKQIQQIKEYAGEAMVSGANSEDEGCSASSDDMVSMHSSTSTDISAANAPLNILESAANMSLEQVLLIDKINSLSGTPMEMSWSDDVIESRDELPHAAIAALNASSNA